MSDFEKTIGLLEGVLKKLGLDPATIAVKRDANEAAWGLKRGSAQVLVLATSSDRGEWVRVIAPVVKLPAAEKRLALFAKLLDLNAKAMRNAAFGVLNEDVVIVSERPSDGLDEKELEQIVRHVATVADHYDDALAKEFATQKGSA